MYRRILAAVNEYTNSEIAARYAIAIAKACEAKLCLAFVADRRAGADELRKAESALERLFLEATASGLEAESVVTEGDPLRRLKEKVKEHGIDLSFISTRHEDVGKRFFTRTRARALLVNLPSSVAMVRVVHMKHIHPSHILVPLRGRTSSFEERAYFTAKMAEAFGASVTLFHSTLPITRFFHGEIRLSAAQREKGLPEDIERFSEYLGRQGVDYEKRAEYGGVSRSITTEAALRRNDLIIMGGSERGALRSVFSGDPAEEVLRETPCNLIILRPAAG